LALQRSQPAQQQIQGKKECTKETGGSTTTRNPRKKNTIPKASTQEKEHTVEPNGGAQKIQIFLCQRKQRWRSPRYGYTSYNRTDRDTANEKNNVADNRPTQENEGTQGSSSCQNTVEQLFENPLE
jgi:hypothetical protein